MTSVHSLLFTWLPLPLQVGGLIDLSMLHPQEVELHISLPPANLGVGGVVFQLLPLPIQFLTYSGDCSEANSVSMI